MVVPNFWSSRTGESEDMQHQANAEKSSPKKGGKAVKKLGDSSLGDYLNASQDELTVKEIITILAFKK